MDKLGEILVERVDEEDEEWLTSIRKLYGEGTNFHEAAAKYPRAYHGAYLHGEMIGHSLIIRAEKGWILDALFVRPDFRRKGIARRLTNKGIEYAIDQGAEEIFFSTSDSNTASIRTHAPCGFVKDSTVALGEHEEPGHWYRLKIE